MSFSDIKELRKAGKLDEALLQAEKSLKQEPENIWNKRAAAWVYYDLIKKHSSTESFDTFYKYLSKIKDLCLPPDEKMVFDNCAWKIGKMVYNISKDNSIEYTKIDNLFSIIREFHFTKPSEAYSFIYKSFHQVYQNWENFLQFADWWGFENFIESDYETTEYNGKKIMALAEKAYIGYSKKLIEGEAQDFSFQKSVNKEKIKSFLPQLDLIISKHPDYLYPEYYKAQLLLLLDEENVLSTFLPFAKQKKNEFWVWELMAKIHSDDASMQFVCYCKGLSLKTSEGYLINMRQKFTKMLIERGMYNEAKYEVDRVIKTREKNGWKIPLEITQWLEEPWYLNASYSHDNKTLYSEYALKADELLYSNLPQHTIVVEYVNEEKKIINFIESKEKQGFFNYSGLIEDPKIGDVLKVRFDNSSKNKFYKVLSLHRSKDNLDLNVLQPFKGKLKIIEPQKFGFVDDIFVEPKLLKNTELKNGQFVNGKALLTFNKKKNEWGWKAISFNH